MASRQSRGRATTSGRGPGWRSAILIAVAYDKELADRIRAALEGEAGLSENGCSAVWPF